MLDLLNVNGSQMAVTFQGIFYLKSNSMDVIIFVNGSEN